MTSVDDSFMNDDFLMYEYHDPDCGRPKGRGRPKRGWVKVEARFRDGELDGRWYCSWECVRDLTEIEMAGGKSE